MTDQGPPPTPGAGSVFCAECGAAMPADAHFCGNCGAAPPPAAAGPTEAAAPGTSGASTWQGVQPVVERPGAAAAGAGAAAAGGGPPTAAPPRPPAGGPPGGPPPGPPSTAPKGRSKTPLIIGGIVLLVVILATVLFLTGGGDDNQDEDAFNRDDAETTTTEAGDTTTTTAAEETTTTAVEDSTAGITFVQVQDATGTLVVEVPDTWVADGTPLGDGSPNILASPDAASLANLAVSGLSYTRLSGTPDPDATIDARISAAGLDSLCTVTDDRQDYTDGVFTGRIQVFEGCGPAGASVFEIVASRADGATVEVTTVIVDPDPVGIFEHIQTTFNLLV